MTNLLISSRPYQWIKNIFLFTPLIFSEHLFSGSHLMKTAAGFLVFSLTSSAVYIFNDILDYDRDKIHPAKRNRPIASGALNKTTAAIFGAVLLIIAAVGASQLSTSFLIVVGIYLLINILYGTGLKEVILLDVFCISSGFLLRVISGAVIIDVPISKWLLVCTLTMSLFLGFAKRRHELVLLGEVGGSHRKVLTEYSKEFLDQIITVLTTTTVISYLLYTISEETRAKFNTDKLIFTSLFVFYGVFRYIWLIDKNRGTGDPSKVLFGDAGIAASVALWFLSAIVIIYHYLPY
ncbi:MAG: decaprenyl-phosphate phosphoribosyltransferase [Ignavibacteriaceae bacterium]|nr:decaprenyl-phosphate phosphoribosyltransferase [Ignavibacteriaceae bacterium]